MRRTILSLVLLVTALPAAAQTPPPSAGEAPMAPSGPMRGMLGRADANGDGTITRAEAIAAADARFDRLDANRDGTVTADEFRAARDAMRDRPDGPPPPPPATDGVRPPPPRPIARSMTREESRTRALEAFARADANADGTVDQAELAAARPWRRAGQRGAMPPPPSSPPPQE